jgi:hypothetical protein
MTGLSACLRAESHLTTGTTDPEYFLIGPLDATAFTTDARTEHDRSRRCGYFEQAHPKVPLDQHAKEFRLPQAKLDIAAWDDKQGDIQRTTETHVVRESHNMYDTLWCGNCLPFDSGRVQLPCFIARDAFKIGCREHFIP